MAIKQKSKSLKSLGKKLSDTSYQLKVLNNHEQIDSGIPKFEQVLENLGEKPLLTKELDILQINIGKLCNQSCSHCHVDAGPDRTEENMSKETLEYCLALVQNHKIKEVDITGGAPEMNPHFRWFVEACTIAGAKVTNRCNLTIIRANPKYHDLPAFFAKHKVHIVSSLPYFSKRRTDSQRGDGVFEDSILALKMLNDVGYGKGDSDLILDLVYNPTGAYLPGSQMSLEKEFKRQLARKFDIEFNSLFAITNIPISRFLDYLISSGNYGTYMNSLHEAFNPASVEHLMCRNTLSVSWDGFLYDCDFNQMLDLKIAMAKQHISEFNFEAYKNRPILVNQHCYGCTAGEGSSCGGAIT